VTLEVKVKTEKECAGVGVGNPVDTCLKHASVHCGTLGVHARILGDGEGVLGRERKTQRGAAEQFLGDGIAELEQLAAEIAAVLYIECGDAGIVLIAVVGGQAGDVVGGAFAVPSLVDGSRIDIFAATAGIA